MDNCGDEAGLDAVALGHALVSHAVADQGLVGLEHCDLDVVNMSLQRAAEVYARFENIANVTSKLQRQLFEVSAIICIYCMCYTCTTVRTQKLRHNEFRVKTLYLFHHGCIN